MNSSGGGLERRGSPSDLLLRWGPFALALFLLACSRWGSHLLPGPPFIADVVLAVLLANRALASGAGRVTQRSPELFTAFVAGGLLLWSSVQFIFSPFGEDALRDAAPYAYLIVLFLVIAPETRRDHALAARWITIALVFHAAWVTLSVLSAGPLAGVLPTSLLGSFEVRADFDSAVCGCLAALSLHRLLLGAPAIPALLLIAWGTGLVLSLETRAGLIAFLVQFAVAAALAPARRRRLAKLDQAGLVPVWRARAIGVAAMVLLLPTVAVVAPSTEPVSRLVGIIGFADPKSESVAIAKGTASARSRAWQRLMEWITANDGRTIVGIGFGQDFMKISGTATLLLGRDPIETARSPHNYSLNTWARLGFIGLALSTALIFAGFRLAYLLVRDGIEIHDVDLLAILLVAALPVVASFGVVLESPFGAVPYFWAIGQLSARLCMREPDRALSRRVA